MRAVEFTKAPHDSLGVSIAGGVGSPLGDIPIFIAMMNPVGIAAQTQKLKVRRRRSGGANSLSRLRNSRRSERSHRSSRLRHDLPLQRRRSSACRDRRCSATMDALVLPRRRDNSRRL